jgi:electron transfer flavoprotein alpha subunit
MSVLVFADVVNGKIAKAAFEATTYGSKIASQLNTTCTVVTHGNIESSVAAELGVYGASKVLLAKNNTAADNEQLTKLIAHAATIPVKQLPDVLLHGSTRDWCPER